MNGNSIFSLAFLILMFLFVLLPLVVGIDVIWYIFLTFAIAMLALGITVTIIALREA